MALVELEVLLAEVWLEAATEEAMEVVAADEVATVAFWELAMELVAIATVEEFNDGAKVVVLLLAVVVLLETESLLVLDGVKSEANPEDV